MEGFDLIHMKPDTAVVKGGVLALSSLEYKDDVALRVKGIKP